MVRRENAKLRIAQWLWLRMMTDLDVADSRRLQLVVRVMISQVAHLTVLLLVVSSFSF